jgi:hypothetical protein
VSGSHSQPSVSTATISPASFISLIILSPSGFLFFVASPGSSVSAQFNSLHGLPSTRSVTWHEKCSRIIGWLNI